MTSEGLLSVAPGASLEELQAKKHPRASIFTQRPAVGMVVCEGQKCSVPYHNYDSRALVTWGSADVDWVTKHLDGPWRPLLGKDGRAQVSLWIVQYVDTSINPYNEMIIVFSVLHASKPDVVVSDPLQQLQLFDDKLASPYIYKLWLDEKLPVTYGRDFLGCDKYLDSEIQISYNESSTVSFEFHHVNNERNAPPAGPLLSGKLKLSRAPHVALQPMHLLSLVRAYGLLRSLGMIAGASSSWHVVNPPGVMKVDNSERVNPVWDFIYETMPKFEREHGSNASACEIATSVTDSGNISPTDAALLLFGQTFAKKSDNLKYGGELLAMNFEAKVYQHDAHLRAVLLPPWTYTPIGDDKYSAGSVE